jgi:hypothetical protein
MNCSCGEAIRAGLRLCEQSIPVVDTELPASFPARTKITDNNVPPELALNMAADSCWFVVL